GRHDDRRIVVVAENLGEAGRASIDLHQACGSKRSGADYDESARAPLARRARLFFAAAQRPDVDDELLQRRLIEALAPGRHDAAAANGDALHDRLLVGTVEPDLVGQIGRADLAIALALRPVA